MEKSISSEIEQLIENEDKLNSYCLYDTEKVLSIIDPAGETIEGDLDAAIGSGKTQMAGLGRCNVYVRHIKEYADPNRESYDYPEPEMFFDDSEMNDDSDNKIEYLEVEYDNSVGRVHPDMSRLLDDGRETDIPSHWSISDAHEYFTLRFNGLPVSERMFDSYLKSGEKEFDNFLKPVVKQFLKNKKSGKSQEESLDAALAFIDTKNRVHQSLEQNKKLTPEIKEGIAKTEESGYKHISRTPKEEVKTPAWMRKRQRGGQGE